MRVIVEDERRPLLLWSPWGARGKVIVNALHKDIIWL